MAMLARAAGAMGCELATSEEFGLPAEAKEAAAFALLAWQTWHHRPGNVPAATGATRPAILRPGDLCVRTRLPWPRFARCWPVAAPRPGIRGTVVFLIESSPANLDPRIGTDGQSEHIDELLFDGLVARDASFHFTPALAERWEQPNPLTLVFHLRGGVRFHDGRPLTAGDVVVDHRIHDRLWVHPGRA